MAAGKSGVPKKSKKGQQLPIAAESKLAQKKLRHPLWFAIRQ